MPSRSILNLVDFRRNLVLLAGMTPLLFCVPASAQTYTIPLNRPGAAAVYTASSPIGWDVTVRLDADRCELHCTYRRKAGAGDIPFLGRLLPPPTTVHVFLDRASKPITVVVDPAGMTYPTVRNGGHETGTRLCLPARRLVAAICPAARIESKPSAYRAWYSPRTSTVSLSPLLPLRI